MSERGKLVDGRHRCVPGSYAPRAASRAIWPSVPAPLAGQVIALANQLMANEWQSPENIRARQCGQLRELTAFAARHSSFHRKRFRAAGLAPDGVRTLDDLRRLPPMLRTDLQNSFDAIRIAALPKGMVFGGERLGTSGSSGTPVEVAVTNVRAQMWLAVTVRCNLWAGLDLMSPVAAVRYMPKQEAPAAHTPEGLILRTWGGPVAQCFATGPGAAIDVGMSLEHQTAFLQRVNPVCLTAFPSALAELAEHFAEHGVTLPALRLVQTVSELVSEDLVERVRDVMGVPIFDTYSSKEVGNIASMCPGGPGYHVHDEGVVLEVLDEAGEPCAPGATGRVLVTDLTNYGFPLIRYDLGDRAVAGEAGVCPCGRGLTRLGSIEGRTWNRLVATDGTRHCNTIFSSGVRKVPFVRRFLFVQSERGSVEVQIVPMAGFGAEHEEQIVEIIQRNLGEEMAVTVTRVERIERLPGGKLADAVCTVETDEARCLND
jgi:phenylacetate-coenzyme A ligase PaaK-like adenylate-forming protein